MKRTLITALLLCAGFCSPLIAQESLPADATGAQETAPAEEVSTPIQLGAHVGVRAGINASEIPTGWKTGVGVGSLPDIGLSGIVPVSAEYNLSTLMDIGVMSTSYKTKPFYSPSDSNTTVTQNQYLSFAPSLLYRYGYVGLNIGIPLASTLSTSDETTTTSSFMSNKQASAFNNELALLLELRVGGYLPLIRDNEGTLSAFLLFSYQLSGTYSSFTKVRDSIYPAGDGTGSVSDIHNPRALSLSLGLRYLFDWSHSSAE